MTLINRHLRDILIPSYPTGHCFIRQDFLC
uniref:Uncharacterized protein n=1 Tax=Anguilla anguilla TaxID=7936 RepID=A0A0E9PUP1_ANGAN